MKVLHTVEVRDTCSGRHAAFLAAACALQHDLSLTLKRLAERQVFEGVWNVISRGSLVDEDVQKIRLVTAVQVGNDHISMT